MIEPTSAKCKVQFIIVRAAGYLLCIGIWLMLTLSLLDQRSIYQEMPVLLKTLCPPIRFGNNPNLIHWINLHFALVSGFMILLSQGMLCYLLHSLSKKARWLSPALRSLLLLAMALWFGGFYHFGKFGWQNTEPLVLQLVTEYWAFALFATGLVILFSWAFPKVKAKKKRLPDTPS